MKTKYGFLSIVLFIIISSSTISCKQNNNDDDDNTPNYTFVDSFKIVVFGSSQCSYCDDLEVQLNDEGIPYTFFDTQESAYNSMMWQKLHDSGYLDNYVDLPVVEVTSDSVRLLQRPDLYDDIIPLITE